MFFFSSSHHLLGHGNDFSSTTYISFFLFTVATQHTNRATHLMIRTTMSDIPLPKSTREAHHEARHWFRKIESLVPAQGTVPEDPQSSCCHFLHLWSRSCFLWTAANLESQQPVNISSPNLWKDGRLDDELEPASALEELKEVKEASSEFDDQVKGPCVASCASRDQSEVVDGLSSSPELAAIIAKNPVPV